MVLIINLTPGPKTVACLTPLPGRLKLGRRPLRSTG